MCPWKCGGEQAGGSRVGSSGVVQDTTNMGAPRVGLWVELHSKESECILGLSTFHYKFQPCAVQLPTIHKELLWSCDQLVQLIHALTTLLYVDGYPDSQAFLF